MIICNREFFLASNSFHDVSVAVIHICYITYLQQNLNHAEETSRCCNLKMNPVKCMVMRFGQRVNDNCEKYQIFGESLQFVKVYKDLGVYI